MFKQPPSLSSLVQKNAISLGVFGDFKARFNLHSIRE